VDQWPRPGSQRFYCHLYPGYNFSSFLALSWRWELGWSLGVLWGSIYVSIGATIRPERFSGRTLLSAGMGWKRIENNNRQLMKLLPEKVGSRLDWLFSVFRSTCWTMPLESRKFLSKGLLLPTWIGITGTVLYVYIGSLAGSLASLGTEGRTRTPAVGIYAVVWLRGHGDPICHSPTRL